MFSSRYLWIFSLIIFILTDMILFKDFEIFGARPDFTFLFVIFAGLSHGFLYGSVVGFAGGLIKDIFLSAHLGSGAFSLTVIGFLAGLFGKRVFYQNILIQVIIIFIVTVFEMMLTNMLLTIIHVSPHTCREIISQAFFNAFVTPPVFMLLGMIFQTKN